MMPAIALLVVLALLQVARHLEVVMALLHRHIEIDDQARGDASRSRNRLRTRARTLVLVAWASTSQLWLAAPL